MSDLKLIVVEFFKPKGEGLVKGISSLTAEKQGSIMTLKASFESERQTRGGCSGCKLRRLMKKYKPQLEAMLNND